MRILPRRGGGRGRRIKGPRVTHLRRPVTLYGVRSPVRIGPRRRRRIPRLRRRGHHGMLKGLTALLKAKKKKGSGVHAGKKLLRHQHHAHLRHRHRHRRRHLLRKVVRHQVHTSFRIKTIKAPRTRYRILRTTIRSYRPPKPPNEMKDIIAAIKGGFKP